MKPKPSSVTIGPWLKSNLGKSCLNGLTGTDWKALLAGVSILELYCYDRNPYLLQAFGITVAHMQEKERWLAFHAIAHVMDWSDRGTVWLAAGLPYGILPARCAFEPK
jgi:hypothetical protein